MANILDDPNMPLANRGVLDPRTGIRYYGDPWEQPPADMVPTINAWRNAVAQNPSMTNAQADAVNQAGIGTLYSPGTAPAPTARQTQQQRSRRAAPTQQAPVWGDSLSGPTQSYDEYLQARQAAAAAIDAAVQQQAQDQRERDLLAEVATGGVSAAMPGREGYGTDLIKDLAPLALLFLPQVRGAMTAGGGLRGLADAFMNLFRGGAGAAGARGAAGAAGAANTARGATGRAVVPTGPASGGAPQLPAPEPYKPNWIWPELPGPR